MNTLDANKLEIKLESVPGNPKKVVVTANGYPIATAIDESSNPNYEAWRPGTLAMGGKNYPMGLYGPYLLREHLVGVYRTRIRTEANREIEKGWS